MIRADFAEIERLNNTYGSVSICGPLSPTIACLPTTPARYFEGFRNAFRSIWDTFRRANFLAIPYDALIEGIPHVKGYYPLQESKTVGTLCSKICGMLTMAQLAHFSNFETQSQYDAAVASMWRRTPEAGAQSQGARSPIAPASMLERMEASDTGPDLPKPKTVDMTALGYYAPEDVPMPGRCTEARAENGARRAEEPGRSRGH